MLAQASRPAAQGTQGMGGVKKDLLEDYLLLDNKGNISNLGSKDDDF